MPAIVASGWLLRNKLIFINPCYHPIPDKYGYNPRRTIISCHGVVSGSTVCAKHAGRDIMAGMKKIFGGKLTAYNELLEKSRDEAKNLNQPHA